MTTTTPRIVTRAAPAHEREPHGEEAEHADDDGGTGDHDCAPGSVQRRDRRLTRVQPGSAPLAETGDHQQDVVDADADAHHRGQGRRPVGCVDHPDEQGREDAADSEPGDGDEERQPRRDDRSEGQQQDGRCGRDPDHLRADLGGLSLDDRLATQGDVQPIRLGALGDRDHPLAVGDGHVDRVHDIEPDMCDKGLTVGRAPAGACVRVVDALDVGHCGELGQQGPDVGPDGCRLDPSSARTTTSTVSPAWAGNRVSSSSWAWLESDPGAE